MGQVEQDHHRTASVSAATHGKLWEMWARPRKFEDPNTTAKGEPRASVSLHRLETLWFNTGTLCNIECANCYIESSPSNDRLEYLTRHDLVSFLDEAETVGARPRVIGFTGGEPFMNPAMIEMLETALGRGHEVLVLTNAMKPMMRPGVKTSLLDLKGRFGSKLALRVSLDHWRSDLHDEERGLKSFDAALRGIAWLSAKGFRVAVAGRLRWGDNEADMRRGYADLFERHQIDLHPCDDHALVLFPEMDERVPVPEITEACWDILHKKPEDMMCASSRMIVKRKGAQQATVVACTLLPYDARFDFGPRLADALSPVRLNHPHCAKFCVLGGGRCGG